MPLERAEVVAERVGPARGPEPDRRRDRREQVVGGDQDAVLEQRQLAVRVPRGGDDLPAVERVAVVDEHGVGDRLMNGRSAPPCSDQLLRDRRRDAVAVEPGRERLDHSSFCPDERSLLGVDRPWQTAAPVSVADVRRRAEVVRVEVGQEDRDDRAVELPASSAAHRSRASGSPSPVSTSM